MEQGCDILSRQILSQLHVSELQTESMSIFRYMVPTPIKGYSKSKLFTQAMKDDYSRVTAERQMAALRFYAWFVATPGNVMSPSSPPSFIRLGKLKTFQGGNLQSFQVSN
jgi:hypothetical protein